MVGLYERQLHGNAILLPEGWHSRGAVWMWRAEQEGDALFLRCAQLERGMDRDSWMEMQENTLDGGRLICLGRIMFMPEILLQYMKRTKQKQAVLIGAGTWIEIWPGNEYMQAEMQLGWESCL